MTDFMRVVGMVHCPRTPHTGSTLSRIDYPQGHQVKLGVQLCSSWSGEGIPNFFHSFKN